MSVITKVARAAERLLNSWADEVAQSTPVVKRRREFSPATLSQTFALGFLAKPHASDDDLATMAARCGVHVTAQAVAQRFTPVLVDFLEALFRRAVRHRVHADRTLAPLLERFAAVFLQDATAIVLPDELRERFAGCGGSYGAGTAVAKFQIRFDLKSGALDAVSMEAGRDCDQRTPLQWDTSTPGALRIADLGYFDTKVFRHLNAHEQFWISRLAFGTEIFTRDERPLPRIEELFAPGKNVVDQEVLMGKDAKVPCRLVVWRVPEEVAARRRRKLMAIARDKGNPPPSPRRLDWCDWTIFVTNTSPAQLSPDEVMVLYRARWQIELLFKRWKSLGAVAEMKGSTVVRRLVRFWSRLLAMVIQHWVMQATAWGDFRCSLFKTWKTVSGHATHLASACRDEGRLAEEIALIGRILTSTAKRNKRKQPGTFELLNDPTLLTYAR